MPVIEKMKCGVFISLDLKRKERQNENTDHTEQMSDCQYFITRPGLSFSGSFYFFSLCHFVETR